MAAWKSGIIVVAAAGRPGLVKGDWIKPGAIVIDEFAGQWIALLLAPMTLWGMLAGFALFRLFDIWKPWPIRQVEKGLGLGGGIVADDIVAGLYTLAVLHTARWLLEKLA